MQINPTHTLKKTESDSCSWLTGLRNLFRDRDSAELKASRKLGARFTEIIGPEESLANLHKMLDTSRVSKRQTQTQLVTKTDSVSFYAFIILIVVLIICG